MISRIVYYGVPNTPELLREHLAHFGFKVTAKRSARLTALYKLMLKEPLQWTDPGHSLVNPCSADLPEYERLGMRAVREDMRLLRESGLVFAFKRKPNLMEILLSSDII